MAALTHTATTGGLTIKSTSGYVDVESVRFTDAKIGIAADIDLVNLAVVQSPFQEPLMRVALSGSTNKFSVTAQQHGSGRYIRVTGATTLSDTLNVAMT